MTLQDSNSSATIREQAAQWVARLHADSVTTYEQQLFENWLSASEERRQAYQAAQAFWESMAALKPVHLPELAAARVHSQRLRQRQRLFARSLALAASVALAILIPWQQWLGCDLYRTNIGEQKTLNLADGSQIILNTNSVVKVSISKQSRQVTLEQGEAFFNVLHDAARPFEVLAGKGKVRDIGTRFNLYRQEDRVDVAVLEGQVGLSSIAAANETVLGAGEQAFFNAEGQISAIQKNPGEIATQWLSGRLTFKKAPLWKVLQQIARYHTVDLQLQDAALSATTISGTFKPQDLKRFLTNLETLLPVKAQFQNGHKIVLVRTAKPKT